MPRRPTGLAHISEKDMAAFRMLWCVEHTPRQLLNLTDSRIKALSKLGYIECCRNAKNVPIIHCTKAGRNFISQLPGFENRRAYVSTHSPAHNCKLATIYAEKSPEQQQNWRTERELAELCHDRMGELRQQDFDRWSDLQSSPWSPADGGVMSDSGELEEAIEVITVNYGDLECKEVFARVLDAPISYYKA
ncbi:MAG: hypothetical protein RR846_09850 [Oscillospiraceae bacterium]